MDTALRNLVRQRAGNCCEYCGIHQDQEPFHLFHIERIIPRQHGGDDDPANLALSCYHCNLHKGPNLTGIDPLTGQIVPLFHPRQDNWNEHFARQGLALIGLTPKGRTTVRLLEMNAVDRQTLRSEWSRPGE